MHGGSIPRGTALPQTRHGRYSKDLPTHLASRFHESQTDPDLLNLRHEISLIDARLGELVASLGDQPGPDTWQAIAELTEQRRKLVETERKRLVDMQQMITAERLMLLVSAVVDVVMRHVDDADVRARISADIGALVSGGAPAAD